MVGVRTAAGRSRALTSRHGHCRADPAATVGHLPAGRWQIRHYDRPWLRGDLIAGLAVAAYLVPQVMAYAELAGLSAVQGLWAAVGPLLLYALFGSSRNLSVGPESTTALMTAVAIATVTAGNTALAATAAAALAVAVGRGLRDRLAGATGLRGRPALQTRADRLHGRHRRAHDRQPAGQDHRDEGAVRQHLLRDRLRRHAPGRDPLPHADPEQHRGDLAAGRTGDAGRAGRGC